MADFISIPYITDWDNTSLDFIMSNYLAVTVDGDNERYESVNNFYYFGANDPNVYIGAVNPSIYLNKDYALAYYALSKSPAQVRRCTRLGRPGVDNLVINEYNIYADFYSDNNPINTRHEIPTYVINPRIFNTEEELFNAFLSFDPSPEPVGNVINYISSNCQLDGPESASSGDDVSVLITPDSGYLIKNPEQGANISVYNKDGYIPFTYSNNQINFTMP